MPSSMGELERYVVQMVEAKRLADFHDIPHGRLALILLDNAAETALVRSAQTGLLHSDMYNNMAYLVKEVDPSDVEGQRLKSEIAALTISKTKRRQLERNFDALVDYVFGQSSYNLPTELGECLKILHRYRNAAYHRDEVRAEVLGPAVAILFYLCCNLLVAEKQLMHEIAPAPADVLDMFGATPPTPSWPGNSFDSPTLARLVAERLLQETALDHEGVAKSFTAHLVGRLQALDCHLTMIGKFILPGVTRKATLRLVQLAPREREEFDAPKSSDFWTRRLPVTQSTLDEWKRRAEGLLGVNESIAVLREFAEIELSLEALEEPVDRFLQDIERMEYEARHDS